MIPVFFSFFFLNAKETRWAVFESEMGAKCNRGWSLASSMATFSSWEVLLIGFSFPPCFIPCPKSNFILFSKEKVLTRRTSTAAEAFAFNEPHVVATRKVLTTEYLDFPNSTLFFRKKSLPVPLDFTFRAYL